LIQLPAQNTVTFQAGQLTNTNALRNQQENIKNLYCFLKWQKGNQHQWRNYQ